MKKKIFWSLGAVLLIVLALFVGLVLFNKVVTNLTEEKSLALAASALELPESDIEIIDHKVLNFDPLWGDQFVVARQKSDPEKKLILLLYKERFLLSGLALNAVNKTILGSGGTNDFKIYARTNGYLLFRKNEEIMLNGLEGEVYKRHTAQLDSSGLVIYTDRSKITNIVLTDELDEVNRKIGELDCEADDVTKHNLPRVYSYKSSYVAISNDYKQVEYCISDDSIKTYKIDSVQVELISKNFHYPRMSILLSPKNSNAPTISVDTYGAYMAFLGDRFIGKEVNRSNKDIFKDVIQNGYTMDSMTFIRIRSLIGSNQVIASVAENNDYALLVTCDKSQAVSFFLSLYKTSGQLPVLLEKIGLPPKCDLRVEPSDLNPFRGILTYGGVTYIYEYSIKDNKLSAELYAEQNEDNYVRCSYVASANVNQYPYSGGFNLSKLSKNGTWLNNYSNNYSDENYFSREDQRAIFKLLHPKFAKINHFMDVVYSESEETDKTTIAVFDRAKLLLDYAQNAFDVKNYRLSLAYIDQYEEYFPGESLAFKARLFKDFGDAKRAAKFYHYAVELNRYKHFTDAEKAYFKPLVAKNTFDVRDYDENAYIGPVAYKPKEQPKLQAKKYKGMPPMFTDFEELSEDPEICGIASYPYYYSDWDSIYIPTKEFIRGDPDKMIALYLKYRPILFKLYPKLSKESEILRFMGMLNMAYKDINQYNEQKDEVLKNMYKAMSGDYSLSEYEQVCRMLPEWPSIMAWGNTQRIMCARAYSFWARRHHEGNMKAARLILDDLLWQYGEVPEEEGDV